MEESSKIISYNTEFDKYKTLNIVFINSNKYVIKVGEFIILKDFILCTFGFVLYREYHNELLLNCFDNKKENYKWVVTLLSDNIIDELILMHYLRVGTDKRLYTDASCSIPYRNILSLK